MLQNSLSFLNYILIFIATTSVRGLKILHILPATKKWVRTTKVDIVKVKLS
jgi:hypothetical protein